jgi:hypothetical protein
MLFWLLAHSSHLGAQYESDRAGAVRQRPFTFFAVTDPHSEKAPRDHWSAPVAVIRAPRLFWLQALLQDKRPAEKVQQGSDRLEGVLWCTEPAEASFGRFLNSQNSTK